MISAIVLAAGLSRRMGTPKMVLPWGDTTVIGNIVNILIQTEINEVVVVTGGAQDQIKHVLRDFPVHLAHNSRYIEDNMVLSLKVGVSRLKGEVEAALVVLGDQPQIQTSVVQAIQNRYQKERAPIIVPSYQMRRGHPWLISKQLWGEVMNLQPPETLRNFLNTHSKHTIYIQVNTDSILRDMDTPSDYVREHRLFSSNSKT